ncbi:MAG: chorismate mutase [Candidatus Dormibacteraeota bacterium]|nr:chorismate mutase [Candidatus Dormibacteraeota bacterium]
MPVRGIRGATTAERNEARAIVEATRELLAELIEANQIDSEEVAFAYFTTTPDLDAEFPALAARELGWVEVPLLCGRELAVKPPNPRGVPRCIRVLVLYNTEQRQKEMRHRYLRGAVAIKRDLEQQRSQLEGIFG